MLHLLLELAVSIVLCAALAYFALLNAPVEAEISEATVATSVDDRVADTNGAASSGDFSASGGGDAEYVYAYDQLLISTHELPLYRTITRFVSLAEDTTLGIAYRWLLINALHYSPREVYGARPLREMGYYYSSSIGEPIDGNDGGATLGSAGTRAGKQYSSANMATSRRPRRRLRRGAAAAAAAPPTPLRKESACWVNVLIRYAAFLCLGGGTVKSEVWKDHLLYGAEEVLHRVNVEYENRLRARVAQARAMAAQPEGASQSTPWADRPSFPYAAEALTGSRKPLLRIVLLELGSGLLGGPPREVNRPALYHHQAGDPPGTFTVSSTMAASGPSVAHDRKHNGGGKGSAHGHQSSAPIAIDAAGSLLPSPVAALSTAIAGAVSCVTTGGSDSVHPIDTVTGPSMLDYAGTSALFASGRGSSGAASAQLGVVLPRVEGSIISVEKPYREGGHEVPPTSTASHPAPPRASPAAASASAWLGTPGPSLLRCFAVPLLYEDQWFYLRLGCCFPLGALLPLSLCVPPDVLTLNCAVAVRRIIFSGHMYAAFHGTRVELSFPTAPLFTAVVKVTPDTSGGGGGVTRSGATPPPPPPAFTTTYTTRNEATAVRASSVHKRPEWNDEQTRPPRPGLHSSNSHKVFSHQRSYYGGMGLGNGGGGSGGGSATASGSCINERNEKIQEIVLLAVHRLIQSVTYPQVLVGELVCHHPSNKNDASEKHLQLKWTRQTASLPLCM